MKEEKNNNNEIEITPEEISNIDPLTISKIILSDGTILKVQKNASTMKENFNIFNENNEVGGTFNLKFNQIPNSSKKSKNTYSYVEWDFPKSKYRDSTYQRNKENKLGFEEFESKTEQIDNNNNKDNSRDSAINKNRKNKNYSYYESKHISKKNKKVSDKNQKNISDKNENNCNNKKLDNKDNKENNIEGGGDDKKENDKKGNDNKIENKKENTEEIKNKNDNIDNKDKNNNKEEKINKKANKENLTFNEKIKMIKYGLLDYDYNSSGLNNEENNIQKINKIRPLNIIIDKTKNKNDEDINTQFNKLLDKYNENKKSSKNINDTNNSRSKNTYKAYGRDNNLNDDINRLNNYIHKNHFHSNFNNFAKYENSKVNNYRDLNERISQLRKKTLNSNLMNFFPSNTTYIQRTKLFALPSNFK